MYLKINVEDVWRIDELATLGSNIEWGSEFEFVVETKKPTERDAQWAFCLIQQCRVKRHWQHTARLRVVRWHAGQPEQAQTQRQ